MNLEPALAFTAEQGWHLEGGLVEQIVTERDEARGQRDHYQRLAARKGDAVNLDEAIEALVSEAESLGLSKQAEKVTKALDGLRDAIAERSEREAAMADVRAAEEALRLAREKAGLTAAPGKRRKYNLSDAERERRRQQAARMREAAAAKRAAA